MRGGAHALTKNCGNYLMPYPVAHMLLGATVAEACLPHDVEHRNWKVACGAALSLVPDLDFILVWYLDMGREWHRGFTHSVVFSLGIGAIWVVVRGSREVWEDITWALALLSHSVLDFLTTMRSAGVELFWPFSNERFRLGFTQLLEPDLAVLSLRETAIAALRISLVEAAIFLPIFMLVCWARRAMPCLQARR